MQKQQIQSIGAYKILETIQDVPEWILLKALEPDSEKVVLIKIYFPKLKWADEFLNEFFDRISYLKFIEHENLLPIDDFGKYQNTPYVVYPYYPFIFYSQTQPDQLDQTEFVNKFYEIAEVLDYLHRQEIVHGLLGPETILIDATGNPKIFDYGLSEILKKVLFENVENKFAFLSLSNVKYTAPELLTGSNPTRQSDIYSYGILFYFGIFGELPFEGKAAPETAILHLENNSIWIKQVSGILSKDSLMLIRKSIALKLENRFESFQEIIKIVGRIKSSNKKNRLINSKLFAKLSENTISVHSIKKTQVNLPTSEIDLDITTDYEVVKQQTEKVKPQRNWVYAVLFVLILASIAGFYYLPIFKKNTPASGSTPTTTQMNISATKPVAVKVPEATIVQATDTPTQMPSLPAPDSQKIFSFFKPALEGEAALVPSEKISTDNLQNLKELSRLGYGKPENVDIAPDSKHFAVATSDGVLLFADNTFLNWIDPGGWASSVQFSPDGTLLAIGLKGGEIQVWDWQKEVMNFPLTGHSGKITRLIFSKNGRHLFSASNDQKVIIWDIKSQKEIKRILAHSAPVEDIAVSDDERTLVTGSDDESVRIWDLSTSSLTWNIPFAGKVLAVAISSDGEYIAAGGDKGKIRQWRLLSQQLRTNAIPVKKRIWNIKYIDNDRTLFVALDDGETRNYSASQEKYNGESVDFEIPPVDVALIKYLGSDFYAESYSDTYRNKMDGVSILWSGEVINRGNQLTKPFFDNIDHLVFSQDGKVIAAQGKRGITSVWNINKNQVIFKDKVGLPWGQPISPDGASIAVIVPTVINSTSLGNEPVSVNIYRWMKLLGSGNSEDLSEAISNSFVSYSEDGKLFISGSSTQSKVWDYESGFETEFNKNKKYNCLITMSANDGKIFQVYSRAGTFLDLTSELTDQSRNICLRSQQGSLPTLSHNLNLLAYVKANGWLEAYDTVSQKTWTNNNHQAITAMAVSPDGSMIALGSPEGKLTFLDGKTGVDLYETIGNYGSLQAIAFSDSGNLVATAGFDGTVRLFGVFPNK